MNPKVEEIRTRNEELRTLHPLDVDPAKVAADIDILLAIVDAMPKPKCNCSVLAGGDGIHVAMCPNVGEMEMVRCAVCGEPTVEPSMGKCDGCRKLSAPDAYYVWNETHLATCGSARTIASDASHRPLSATCNNCGSVFTP